MEAFANGLRVLLRDKVSGVGTQKDLSRITGLSQGGISQIIAHKRGCEIGTMESLASAFDLNALDVIKIGMGSGEQNAVTYKVLDKSLSSEEADLITKSLDVFRSSKEASVLLKSAVEGIHNNLPKSKKTSVA